MHGRAPRNTSARKGSTRSRTRSPAHTSRQMLVGKRACDQQRRRTCSLAPAQTHALARAIALAHDRVLGLSSRAHGSQKVIVARRAHGSRAQVRMPSSVCDCQKVATWAHPSQRAGEGVGHAGELRELVARVGEHVGERGLLLDERGELAVVGSPLVSRLARVDVRSEAQPRELRLHGVCAKVRKVGDNVTDSMA
eukprot:4917983-Pleurochrysis_carterae.AAC.2